MKIQHCWITPLIACVVASAALAAPPTAEQLEKIKAALPAEAPAKPAKARKLLIFTRTAGFRHSSIEVAAVALKLLGEKSGAYTADHSEDPALFTPDNLKQYDAICLVSTTMDFLPEASQINALLEFVRSGKGLVGIHGASDAFYKNEEYGKMIGGYFDGHPWNANDKVTLKIESADHACNACFKGMKNLEITDEIYQFKPEPYSRAALRVLTSLDTKLTDMTKPGVKRGTDGDYAVSWVKTHGEGRVFYCSLGHREDIYWNPIVLGHYLAGIQFAFGDLKVDATPSGGAGNAQLINGIKTYKVGAGSEITDVLSAAVAQASGDPAAKARLESDLLAVLTDASATEEGRQLVCRQIWNVASGKSLPVLGGLLADEKLSHMARYALERMKIEGVNEQLVAALGTTNGPRKIGVVNTLAARRAEQAVTPLAALVSDADTAVGSAAIAALGKIGSDAAVAAIQAARTKSEGETRELLTDAYLAVADGYFDADQTAKAAPIYRELFEGTESQHIRTAALRGMVSTDAQGIKLLVGLLGGEDAAMKVVAVRMLQQSRDPQAVAAMVEALPAAKPGVQAIIAEALGLKGDTSAGPAVAKLAQSSGDEAVRSAAVKALAKIGDGSSVPLLAEIAAASKGELRNTARQTLASLRGRDIDGKVLESLPAASKEVAVELVRTLGERQATQTVPQLLELAASDKADAAVRREAFSVLGKLSSSEQYPGLVGVTLEKTPAPLLPYAERAVAAAGARVGDAAQRVAPVLAAHGKASGESRAASLRLLSTFGGETALGAVRGDLQSSDTTTQQAAVRALAAWPNFAAADDLLALAENSADASAKILALRGYIRLAGLPSDRPAAQTVAMFQKSLTLAGRVDEKRLVLAGLAGVPSDESLKLVQALAADAELKTEAEQAGKRIEDALKAQANSR